jgi:ketosteroid isomerase-like protein
VNTHPLAASVAAAVADRALDRLGAHLTDEVRLRGLLPGGPIEVSGREAVLATYADWFGSFDQVALSDAAGDEVGDRVLVHYKLAVEEEGKRYEVSQTVLCSVDGDRVTRMDLVCSGFRGRS